MPKPVRAASRFALGAVAALALVFGGLTAPAFADDLPVEPPVSESDSVETPTDVVDKVVTDEEAIDEEGSDLDAPEASLESEGLEESGPVGPMSFGTMDVDEEPSASISVSPSTGLDPAGATITVTGSGFDSTTAAAHGAPGTDAGIYVQVGWIKDGWQPSLGGVNNEDRKSAYNVWVTNRTGTGYSQWTDEATGSFSVSFTIDQETLDAAELADAQLAVFTTVAGGAAANGAYEKSEVIAFADPVPSASISVSPSTGLDPAGATITVTGSGFDSTTAAAHGAPGTDAGIYVQVGWIKDGWQPSLGGVNNEDRKSAYNVWVTNRTGTGYSQWTDEATGSFSVSFTIDQETLDAAELADAQLAVFTTVAGGAAANGAYEKSEVIAFADPVPSASMVPTVTSATTSGATVRVVGSGLDGITGAYAEIREKGSLSVPYAAFGYWADGTSVIAAGAFDQTLTVPAAKLDPAKTYEFIVYPQHSAPTAESIYARADVPFISTHWSAIFPSGTPGGGTGDGDPGTDDPGTAAPAVSLSPSSINPTVANTVTVSGSGFLGAGAASGVYVSLGASSVWQPGRVPSDGGWVTTVWVTPAQLSGGSFTTTLSIPAGALSVGTTYGVATFAAHGLSLTNRSLDTWTSIGLSLSAPATATATGTREPAPTPPSSTGATLDKPQATASGQITITAGGFQPNETGILVVLYSDPVVLTTNATADANGVVTWTGYLPAGLTGSHTLTLQGSINVGAPITIKPAVTTAAGSCTISDATLTWGFKESFRAYITSTIANGEWIVADGASYETPEFSWSGAGSLDPETETADLAFEGSVRFTGHDGALDTTIANPRVVLSADGAVLLIDVSGTTQDGSAVDSRSIEFATLDLSAVSPDAADGTLVWSAVPAVLTEAGSAAFGTYEAGEALDPVTLVIVLPSECGAVAVDETPGPEVTTAVDGQSDAPDLTWLWWLIGGLVLLAIVIAIIVTVPRRRNAA